MKLNQAYDIEQIYSYIDALKNGKRLISNAYLDSVELNNAIENQELFYEYKEGSYLNLLHKNDGFYRMYFYIVDPENYHFETIGTTVVCDIFTKQADGGFLKILNTLHDNNFVQYACFQKWVRRFSDDYMENCPEGFVFGNEKNQEVIDLLFATFDKYTDCLPRRCEIETFLKDKKFINVYETQGHKYLGSLIYTERSRLAITEFYFIKPEEKGKRISYLLHDHYYHTLARRGYQFVSWVNINNKPSIAVHEKYHYQKGMYKYTLLNREDS